MILRLLELVEMEVRELLDQYDFPGDDTPIIVGSALKALEGDTSDIGMPAVQKLIETWTLIFLSLSERLTKRF